MLPHQAYIGNCIDDVPEYSSSCITMTSAQAVKLPLFLVRASAPPCLGLGSWFDHERLHGRLHRSLVESVPGLSSPGPSVAQQFLTLVLGVKVAGLASICAFLEKGTLGRDSHLAASRTKPHALNPKG